jgi:hypothetical protein
MRITDQETRELLGINVAISISLPHQKTLLFMINKFLKGRHSRENGNPGEYYMLKKTGFLHAQE